MTENTLQDAPEWHQFLQEHVRGGRVRVLIDHLADISEVERLNVTGAYICPGAKFNVTSDAFALVDFVDSYGQPHPGAFWGTWDDTVQMVSSLAGFIEKHCTSKDEDKRHELANDLVNALHKHLGTNYAKKGYM